MSVNQLSVQSEKKVILSSPSLEDIKKAVNELWNLMGYDKEYPYQKILVRFAEEVNIRVNANKRKKMREMTIKFFESQQGSFCYSFYSSSGYPLSYIDYDKIKSLSIFGRASDSEIEQEVKKISKRFHPNVWDDLKNDIDKMKRYYLESGNGLVNIKGKFPLYVIEDLKEAFDQKLNYNFKMDGVKRDLSVSTGTGEDGIFRAWFSSEYAGCGNGSYYILINPTTAAFREDD